ncbi:hypothetical protein OSB04_024126 [Centaurea solstitialis]|uniref:CCHC-type domain-containing protein n=1 Tax=Centaurea solstitialis TaxID=347529 RepID=A0AA38SM69_9ASTR|nr:hypothetical protein OSB04_024126 [Centaurea solstitialis]
MIVLRHERKWYVLEEPLGEAPPANAPAAARNAHKKHSDDLLDVACLMLATMSPDLQAGLINTNAYDMIRQLRDMFQTQARTERYDATKAFNECKMVKGTSVSDHVMKMKRHLDHLERLGHPVPLQLATDTILNSLSEDYRPFVVNYNINNMEKTIAELHSMLKTAELNMGNKNKTKDVLMVKDGGVKKKNGQASTSKGKGPVQAIQSAPKKGKSKGKGKKVKPNKARTENRCFICNEIGHWRQNCPKRHEAVQLEGRSLVDHRWTIIKQSRHGRLDVVIERLKSTRVKIPLRTSWDSEFAYLSQKEYELAIRAQEEHNKKQKEAFLSSQAAKKLAFDFVEEDEEISADPILAQKAALKVFNKRIEEETEEVDKELDWCRDRLHLRKHGARIVGIHLRRNRGKKGVPGKTWLIVKRSGVKDVEHTLDKAEVEEAIDRLIARIRRTTEIPDVLLQPPSALPKPPVRRSTGTSTRRPTPCMPRTAYKPLDLSMLDLSFLSGVSLSEGQVIREPVHGICVGDNLNILRFQRFSELHKAPTEHLVSVLFIANKEKKNQDNKEFVRAVRAILDHRIANGETPFTIQDQEMNESVMQSTDPDHRSEDLLKTLRSYSKNHQRSRRIS